jgi:xanthine dehydrogenase accessory factor
MDPNDIPQPRTASAATVMRAALDLIEAGKRVVVATVLERRGSTPSTPGQKLVLSSADEAIGTVGGGAVERQVLATMIDARRGVRPKGKRSPATIGEPFRETYELGASMGMCCGGSVDVLFEVLDPAIVVLIVGAGHIGAVLAPMLAGLGFRVVICDQRETMIERFSSQEQLTAIYGDHDDPDVGDAIGDTCANGAAVVMTHDHQLDQQVIEWAIVAGFGFVGGVGSRAKAARTRARLEAKSFDAADVARVQMPLGLDISARLPAEIAVSICGQLIRWRAELLGTDRRTRGALAETAEVVAK